MHMKVIVTGANGFVGTRFMQYNQARFQLEPLSLRSVDWSKVNLAGIDAVVHLAGKAHDMHSTNDAEYFEINYDLTKKLADKAREQGVPHFIYISTVKVYGDEDREVLNEQSDCHPEDAYGKSKLQAELYLRSIENNQFRVAIVRPPLVYGPGVKGNLIRVLGLAGTNLPLPFARTANKRSMVYLDNLVELLNSILEKRSSGTFVAGDEHTVSTEELIAEIRRAMHKKPRLISIPALARSILRKLKPAFYKRLFGSFVIDNQNTNKALQFAPPYSFEYGIGRMVEWYQSQSTAAQGSGPLAQKVSGEKSSGLV